MNALRALLNAPPIASKDELVQNIHPTNTIKQEVVEETLENQDKSILDRSKDMKKSAFEAWHTRKFDKLCSNKSENDTLSDPQTEDLSELRKILSAPSALAQKKEQSLAIPIPTSSMAQPLINPISNVPLNMDLVSFLLRQMDPKTLLNLLQQNLLSAQNTVFLPQFLSSITPMSPLLVLDPSRSNTPQTFQEPDPKKILQAEEASSKVIKAKKLTTPRLSRHNDAAYYPNIQCILCKEWVCSRNRHMHVESHLQYRPYKCSICPYDNRKQIFVTLHIRKAHEHIKSAHVVFTPNPDLEHRAWLIAEKCLQHTREVLAKGFSKENPEPESVSTQKENLAAWAPILEQHEAERYAFRYRPKIFNALRIEKSQIIEESRTKGLMPDLSEVASKEIRCELCSAMVYSSPHVMEEHVRTHLFMASYRCPFPGCPMVHYAKGFVARHTNEIHKIKKHCIDLVQENEKLKEDLAKKLVICFPSYYQNRFNIDAFEKTEEMIDVESTTGSSETVQNTAKDMTSLYSTLSALLFSENTSSISQNLSC